MSDLQAFNHTYVSSLSPSLTWFFLSLSLSVSVSHSPFNRTIFLLDSCLSPLSLSRYLWTSSFAHPRPVHCIAPSCTVSTETAHTTGCFLFKCFLGGVFCGNKAMQHPGPKKTLPIMWTIVCSCEMLGSVLTEHSSPLKPRKV